MGICKVTALPFITPETNALNSKQSTLLPLFGLGQCIHCLLHTILCFTWVLKTLLAKSEKKRTLVVSKMVIHPLRWRRDPIHSCKLHLRFHSFLVGCVSSVQSMMLSALHSSSCVCLWQNGFGRNLCFTGLSLTARSSTNAGFGTSPVASCSITFLWKSLPLV